MEDIPGCIVAPGLPRPDQVVDWSGCSLILALVKSLTSLDWLLLVACAKQEEEHKELQVLLQSSSTLEHF